MNMTLAKFIDLSLLRVRKRITHEEYKYTVSWIAHDKYLIETFIKGLLDNFYKLGKDASIRHVKAIDPNMPDDSELNMFVVTPLDLLDMLETYESCDENTRNRFKQYIHSLTPSAWKSRSYLPDEDAKTFHEMQDEAFSNQVKLDIKRREDPTTRYT